MKQIDLLLMICVGMSAVVASENSEIACSRSREYIQRSSICNDFIDCHDATDENTELCNAWRNTTCGSSYTECTRNGVTRCVEISEFCASENPTCEGELDRRICSMLKTGRLDKFKEFIIPSEKEVRLINNYDEPILPNTISDGSCPKFYTLVGDKCLSLFYIASMSWGEARAFCNVLGGDLFAPTNAGHFADIVQHLQIHELPSDFWIGGSIPNTTVGWTWLDGSPMEGSPFWATRYSPTCVQGNSPITASETTCYHYYQTPEEVTKGECASLSFQHSFYMTDEDCLKKKSPLCVYQGHDFPKYPKL